MPVHAQLRALILRKFKSEGDVDLAQRLVTDSNGIKRARELAAEHAALAARAVSHHLPQPQQSSGPVMMSCSG